MILTGPEIRRLAEGGAGPNGERIVIDPFDPKWCGSNSCDVHLDDEVRVYETDHYLTSPDSYVRQFLGHRAIDPLHPPATRPAESSGLPSGGWVLEPGRVYLASTLEYTETHGLVPVLYGRSSIGRLGLFIHVTAGFGDDGFCGHWTLELVATQPVIVRPGMKIGQLIYHTIHGERQAYQGRYQNQPKVPVASRFHLPDQQGAKT